MLVTGLANDHKEEELSVVSVQPLELSRHAKDESVDVFYVFATQGPSGHGHLAHHGD